MDTSMSHTNEVNALKTKPEILNDENKTNIYENKFHLRI